MIESAREISEMFKVLANENRLIILCYLIDKPMTVTELHNRMHNLTQSALSQHLSLLKAHRILDYNKTGLNITYHIHDERIISMIEAVKLNYCEII